MDTVTAFLFLGLGLLIRLAIPIAVTCVLVYLLRKLDARWQTEAKFQSMDIPKPECWKLKNCPADQQETCIARYSPQPCWQVFRQSNGYLKEECLSCKVLIQTPPPTLQAEPRRM